MLYAERGRGGRAASPSRPCEQLWRMLRASGTCPHNDVTRKKILRYAQNDRGGGRMTEQFCAELGSRLRATAPAGPANGCYGRVKRFFVGLITSSEQQADFKMIFIPFNF